MQILIYETRNIVNLCIFKEKTYNIPTTIIFNLFNVYNFQKTARLT